eukprot:Skav214829  [mRNA]  locus=scaffold1772:187456:188673:+ [translate_table: standard]
MPDTLVTIAVGRLPGRQTINRAELSAIIWVFRHFPSAVVHTDSSYADAWVHSLKADPTSADCPMLLNYDLLQQLRGVLRETHSTVKVKAHQDVHKMTACLPAYHALGNQAANDAAVEANRSLLPALGEQLHGFAKSYQEEATRIHTIFRYLLDLNVARAKQPFADTAETAPELHHTPLLLQVRTWQTSDSWHSDPVMDDTALDSSAWGLQVMHAMQQWLMDCKWPCDALESPGPRPMGLSWVEVAMAVCIHLGCWLPVPRVYENGEVYLVQPRSHAEALLWKTSLKEQATLVSQVLTQYQNLVVQSTSPPFARLKVRSLLLYGFEIRQHGMSLRPSFGCQNKLSECLQEYVRTHGATLAGLPQLHGDEVLELWPEDMRCFGEKFAVLKQKATIAQQRVRRARKLL